VCPTSRDRCPRRHRRRRRVVQTSAAVRYPAAPQPSTDCWWRGKAIRLMMEAHHHSRRHHSNDCDCFCCPGVVCGPCFPFGTYSTVDGGVPKGSKNDHFIPFCSMNDNGMIIRSK
jgi:hypothetical protein